MLPTWLTPFFTFFPLYALFFLGIGVPWALVLLPRDEWRNRLTVLGTGLALGPLFGTTWLFILGTWGTFEAEEALTGVVMLCLVGSTGAWLRRHRDYLDTHQRQDPWTSLEKMLLLLLGVGLLVNIWTSLFWTFTQYDTLWTFGYYPRAFLYYREIPTFFDYYPLQVPLTYTFGQLINGGMNDHVARAAIPWYIFSSVMMAYLLGARLWGKRTIGILTAALWLLLPHGLIWSNAGDLEHPIAIYFTGACLFFVMAWRSHRRRYAFLSGLLLAGALWTKPTGGAFALGVILVIAVATVRLLMAPNRADAWLVYRDKLKMALITALACLPIGSMWYLRNAYYDHNIIDFPPAFWHDLAQRSGQELGWLIVMAVLAAGWLTHLNWAKRASPKGRNRLGLAWLGVGLLLLGTLPNALGLAQKWTDESLWQWTMGARPPDGRLNGLEITLIIVGLGLLGWQLRGAWERTTARARSATTLCALLIAPFTLVWFFNFSYHYRLMLTITPVLAAMTAALLEAWVLPLMQVNKLRQRALLFLSVWLCLPGLVLGSWSTVWYTWFDPLETDAEKYAAANPALMRGVAEIAAISERSGRDQLFVMALGDTRYNFFFPHMHSIWRMPDLTSFDDLPYQVDLILGGSHADFYWHTYGLYPNQLSAYMDVGFRYSTDFIEYGQGSILGLPLTPLFVADDGNDKVIGFNYYPPYRNYSLEEIQPPFTFQEDHWSFLALRGMDVRQVIGADSTPIAPDENGSIALAPGAEIYLQLYWQRTTPAPPPADYTVFIHLIDPRTGEILSQRDSPLLEGLLPMTLMAYPDLVPDRRYWQLPDDLPPGELDLLIGLFDPLTQQRTPLMDGTDALRLQGYLRIKSVSESDEEPAQP